MLDLALLYNLLKHLWFTVKILKKADENNNNINLNNVK